MPRDIYSQIAALNSRARKRRQWAKRKRSIVAGLKLAGVAMACLAMVALAIPLGLAFGVAFAP